MSDKKPKYAVVAVHGIGSGTGDERYGFSVNLKKGVGKLNPECENLWFEAPWEGLNDSVDAVVKTAADELFDSYIRDAEEEKVRVEKWISSLNVDSGCWLWTIIKKGFVWVTRKTTGITPDGLRKAKRITPSALDAVLDLPIYLGKDKGTEIRAEIFKKIDEAMSRGVEGVVLVGHSLGSVIAFDVLQEELKKGMNARIKALVTLGSPLEWVSKVRNAMTGETAAHTFDVHGTQWFNYYDPQDPVPLRRALNGEMFKGVKNEKDVSGEILISAHCAYWKSPRIAAKIVELMCGIS